MSQVSLLSPIGYVDVIDVKSPVRPFACPADQSTSSVRVTRDGIFLTLDGLAPESGYPTYTSTRMYRDTYKSHTHTACVACVLLDYCTYL